MSLIPIQLRPNATADSEEVIAYEAGWRRRFGDDIDVDVAAFYNDYSELLTFTPFRALGNDGSGQVYGAEISTTWRVADNLKLFGGWTWARVHLDGDAIGDNTDSPEQQLSLRGTWDLTDDVSFNLMAFYTDLLGATGINDFGIVAPDWRLDASVQWRVDDGIDLMFGVQDALDSGELEFGTGLSRTVEIERRVFARATLRF